MKKNFEWYLTDFLSFAKLNPFEIYCLYGIKLE